MEKTMNDFMKALSSKEPIPGGGGASALIGAVSSALCSMVANLTTGKKKYAQFQEDIDKIILKTEEATKNLISFIEKDAEVFKPLSEAYGIPKEDTSRDSILENALVKASSVPMEILAEANSIIDIIEELSIKGSRLAISDIAVAATACRSAMEGAAMNVFINTNLMKNKEYAVKLNKQATTLLENGCKRCEKVYEEIVKELRCDE